VTGAGRPRTVLCDDNIERVEQLTLSQEDKPGTHSAQREIAREHLMHDSETNPA